MVGAQETQRTKDTHLGKADACRQRGRQKNGAVASCYRPSSGARGGGHVPKSSVPAPQPMPQ